MVLLWLRFFSSASILSSGFRRQTSVTQHGCVLLTTKDTKFGKNPLSNRNANPGKTAEPRPNRLNSKSETRTEGGPTSGQPCALLLRSAFFDQSRVREDLSRRVRARGLLDDVGRVPSRGANARCNYDCGARSEDPWPPTRALPESGAPSVRVQE